MKVERFAGDNEVFQQFAQQMAVNDTLMARRQAEALQNAYEQRARDVAATGVTNAGLFL